MDNLVEQLLEVFRCPPLFAEATACRAEDDGDSATALDASPKRESSKIFDQYLVVY